MPLDPGDHSARFLPPLRQIAEAGVVAVHLVRRSTDRALEQVSKLFLQDPVGWQPDSVAHTFDFKELVDIRVGEGRKSPSARRREVCLWHLPAVSGGDLGRAAIRCTADSPLASHIHSSLDVGSPCLNNALVPTGDRAPRLKPRGGARWRYVDLRSSEDHAADWREARAFEGIGECEFGRKPRCQASRVPGFRPKGERLGGLRTPRPSFS